jgi:hypothetical protein
MLQNTKKNLPHFYLRVVLGHEVTVYYTTLSETIFRNRISSSSLFPVHILGLVHHCKEHRTVWLWVDRRGHPRPELSVLLINITLWGLRMYIPHRRALLYSRKTDAFKS